MNTTSAPNSPSKASPFATAELNDSVASAELDEEPIESGYSELYPIRAGGKANQAWR